MDTKLVDILLDSSRQLNLNVSELTKAVHELTVTTQLQKHSTDTLVERIDTLEAWKATVDQHMSTMRPVTGVVRGISKAIISAIAAGSLTLIGYQLLKAKDSAPQKRTAPSEQSVIIKET